MRYTPGRLGSDAMNSLGSNSLMVEKEAHRFTARTRSPPGPASRQGRANREARELTGARDHVPEHLRREAAGRGVVAAAMIRVEEVLRSVEAVLPTVPEPVTDRKSVV